MPAHTLAERRKAAGRGARSRVTSSTRSRSRVSTRLSGALTRAKKRQGTSRPGGGRRRISAAKGSRRR